MSVGDPRRQVESLRELAAQGGKAMSSCAYDVCGRLAPSTLRALERRKLVQRQGGGWWSITDAGRAALRTLDGGSET